MKPTTDQKDIIPILETAKKLMRVCFDEANRLSNHGENAFTETNLYNAANEAKKILKPYL